MPRPRGRKPNPNKVPKVQVGFALPADLVQAIDENVEELGISKTRWAELVFRDALSDRAPRNSRQTGVAWDPASLAEVG